MKGHIKKIAIFAVIVLIVLISIFLILPKQKTKKQIQYIETAYTQDNVQSKLAEVEIEEDASDMMVKIDDADIIGTIKIDKINFEGLVYEGTSLETLKKGVGHFETSPYFDGNVCLAAHNTSKFWAKLNTLKTGDKISYVTFLGTKEYEVFDMLQIEETDWSKLEDTDENILTLITCIKGNKPKRLCVQAIEIK